MECRGNLLRRLAGGRAPGAHGLPSLAALAVARGYAGGARVFRQFGRAHRVRCFTASGIAEQDAWIAARYPGARKVRQAVTECGATPVDRITFERNGVEKTVLFDISSFFGKVGKDDLDDLLAG